MAPPLDTLQALTEQLQLARLHILEEELPAWVPEHSLQDKHFRLSKSRSLSDAAAIRARASQSVERGLVADSATRLDRLSWSVSRNAIADAICDLWYTGDGDGRFTQKLQGWVMAGAGLWPRLREINLLKTEFEVEMIRLRSDSNRKSWALFAKELQKKSNRWRHTFGFRGAARICLRQTYRHLPLIDEVVEKIGYSYSAHSKSIKSLSHGDALSLLDAAASNSSEHVIIQMERLSALSGAERLVQVQDMAAHFKANIKLATTPSSTITRKCALPFFIPQHHTTPQFTRKGRSDSEGRSRLYRSDISIEDSPLLPTVRVHLSTR